METYERFITWFVRNDRRMFLIILAVMMIVISVYTVLDEWGDLRWYFMYAEDIDLTRRMHERYRTIFYPRVSIVHVHRAESRHSFKMLKVHIVSLVKYFNKWGWLFDRQRRRFNRQVLEELGCCK